MSARSKADITQADIKDRKYWEAQLVEAIKDFYYCQFEVETIADIQKTPHNTFNAALEYARAQVVKRGDLLEYVEHDTPYKSTVYNEQYSAEAVGELCEAYISICSLFDRVPSLYSFSILSGIDRTLFYQWQKVEGVSCTSRLDKAKSVKDLKAAREASLSNLALSGGKSALGAIAHLNNTVWNGQGYIDEKKAALSLSELPDLYPRFAVEDKGGSDAPVGSYPVSPVGLPVLDEI